MKQVENLAWDITDWDKGADLTAANLRYNMHETFVRNGLALPSSIICRQDQENALVAEFSSPWSNPPTNIKSISTEFGAMQLKVLPLERVEVTIRKTAHTY